MATVYLVLLACTMAPVIALQLGADATVLVWMVFTLVLIKAILLVDHFMEMKHAPRVAAGSPGLGCACDRCLGGGSVGALRPKPVQSRAQTSRLGK